MDRILRPLLLISLACTIVDAGLCPYGPYGPYGRRSPCPRPRPRPDGHPKQWKSEAHPVDANSSTPATCREEFINRCTAYQLNNTFSIQFPYVIYDQGC